ncbi:protein-L-isoaspartate(D-aspartate) O-methyltransferase [Thiosocius teredinicola]|uniref:protein-L-isoaspartate(D-aspartate) O-methyltransferase n=1 Tax=Thiosocius teredinicola TaxID=1973002 RepID=UPI000F77EB5D
MSSKTHEADSMLQAINDDVALTRRQTGRDALAPAVIDALRRVPRHAFVDDDLKDHAYDNRPLPIGRGQTISQPFIVALMTELAEVGKGARVLEVGTGSGYQCAVLAELADEVYSVEIVPELAENAARRLKSLGYRNVSTKFGDGYEGWPDKAPFDAIIVTAATPLIPPPLIEQLKPGGRLVLPLGQPHFSQELVLLRKNAHGEIETHNILPVAFVPLTGQHARGD